MGMNSAPGAGYIDEGEMRGNSTESSDLEKENRPNEIISGLSSEIERKYNRLVENLEASALYADVEYFSEKNAKIVFDKNYNKGEGRFELDQTYTSKGSEDDPMVNGKSFMFFENIEFTDSHRIYRPFVGFGDVGRPLIDKFVATISDKQSQTPREFIRSFISFLQEKFQVDADELSKMKENTSFSRDEKEQLCNLADDWRSLSRDTLDKLNSI